MISTLNGLFFFTLYDTSNAQTARLYSATNIEDVVAVTHRIHMLYPKAAIIGIGVSLGGYVHVYSPPPSPLSFTLALTHLHLSFFSMILTQYCHRLGKECDLKAVISVCACMDPFATKHSLENQYINRNFYTTFLINEICDIVERYAYYNIVM